MQLTKVIVSGFKSVSPEHKQIIELEPDVTAFIGHNGTGKSSLLEALNKLFAIDRSLRGVMPEDFYLKEGDKADEDRDLFIEAWFCFPKKEGGDPAIPILINGLTVNSSNKEVIFRVRLEAKISFDYSLNGDVEENIWIIDGDMDDPQDHNKHRLSSTQRNAIQVNYIPANRDPIAQLKYSSKAILGRLLKAISWSDTDKASFEGQAQSLNNLAIQNPALVQISKTINTNWQQIYKGRHLNTAGLNFPLSDVDEILRLIQLQFMPDATGNKVDTSRLSDGQKSLVYFALTKALFDIDKETREALANDQHSNFDAAKMKLPIFSLIALEEPENHLSPHYLGRIIKLIEEYGDSYCCQSVVSTHSASLVGRVKPHQIRHFRLDCDTKSTRVSALTLPDKDDERAKYISEAVKAYPEIYFSKIVILAEGDSEQVIIPKILELYGTSIDSFSISVVPLGGRHINHFWRLLDALKIPYVTLLDFDIDRNGGGFGRIKYAIEQLSKYDKSEKYLHEGILNDIPKWDDRRNPIEFSFNYREEGMPGGKEINLVERLEVKNIYFSNPLDIDYSMICSFPDIFCEKDESYNERGPSDGKPDEEDGDSQKRHEALIKAVLKKGNTGLRYKFGNEWERNFTWYRYRFLSNKSKPASHVRMFTKIEDKYNSDEIKQKIPTELKRLAEKVIFLAEQVVE
ncbi:ATP-dependent endonuclease [Photobacterium phosphoreum]|uniref:ATP-dependent nuclease n=1 Tax=Photobacterium phosphoreum TaxID=659 RepID=UPI000D1816D9|nr:AAA family ATPase [Photobacterium phosphoreum]MCD9481687.1 AAA family ATPase [Photobacterium phosphoreum]PSU75146.1 ATP-dependent endonuclease [Photobacterium phosphoreum]